MARNKNGSSGFTLIELLIVIAIIGLLASIVLVNLASARVKARDVKRKADLKTLQTGLELYFNINNRYPIDLGACDTSIGFTGPLPCTTFVSNSWPAGGLATLESTGLVAKMPLDPLNNTTYYYYYEPVENQTQFNVTCVTTCAYIIGARLENLADPSINATCAIGDNRNYCVTGGGAQQ